MGVVIVGVSPDGVESHQQFRAKYELLLILLSDPDHRAIVAYDVWRQRDRDGVQSMGIERSTFLIDEQGILIGQRRKVQVDGHVAEMLEEVR